MNISMPEDTVAKLAVGLVLLTMGVLVTLALLSFLGERTPLDAQPADVIKAAADAAADAAAEGASA